MKKIASSSQYSCQKHELDAPHFRLGLPVHTVALIALLCFPSTFFMMLSHFKQMKVSVFKFVFQYRSFSQRYLRKHQLEQGGTLCILTR